jgi:DNA-binding MarR family transcriptional regulator
MAESEDVERGVKALLAVTRGIRLCEEQTAAEFGISAAQLAITAVLGRKGRCSVGELAAELHVDQSSISSSAKALLNRQMIRRVRSSDSRRVEFTLAARGRTVVRKIGITGRPLLEAALATIPSNLLRGIIPELHRIASAMLDQRELALKSQLEEA